MPGLDGSGAAEGRSEDGIRLSTYRPSRNAAAIFNGKLRLREQYPPCVFLEHYNRTHALLLTMKTKICTAFELLF